MICCAFRFVTEEQKPSGWYGIAVASNVSALIDKIDEHGDPYSCEVIKINKASVCFFTRNNDDDAGSGVYPDFHNEQNKTELDDRTSSLLESDKWRPFQAVFKE